MNDLVITRFYLATYDLSPMPLYDQKAIHHEGIFVSREVFRLCWKEVATNLFVFTYRVTLIMLCGMAFVIGNPMRAWAWHY